MKNLDYNPYNMDLKEANKQMEESITSLKESFNQLQVWKASSNMVENINIYVKQRWISQPLGQLSNISILDSQTIKIEPWDKNIISSIEKGIIDNDLWLTPTNQWDYLIIKIPPLTKERREELSKVVKKMGEETKVKIRNIRQERQKTIKNDYEDENLSEDQKKAEENKLDDTTREYTEKVNEMVKNKEEQIMDINS